MKLFESSRDALRTSGVAFDHSMLAFEAEMSAEAFYSAAMHLKMASTIFCHMARCVANLALIFHAIINTIHKAYIERDTCKVITTGCLTVTAHFVAALIDLVNIFVTLGAVIVRSAVSLIDGYQKSPRGAGFLDKLAAKTHYPAALLEYTRASSLSFTPNF